MSRLRWKNFLLPALYYLAILSVSLIPRSGVEKVDLLIPLPNDKVLHAAVYAGFGFVLGGLPYPAIALGTAGSFLGALDEQVQRLAPGRDVSFADWLADILGISLGLTLRRRFRP
jgi:VanZ family protein